MREKYEIKNFSVIPIIYRFHVVKQRVYISFFCVANFVTSLSLSLRKIIPQAVK